MNRIRSWLAARWLTWTPGIRWLLLLCLLIGALGGAGLAARLFAGGTVGLADNGDGARVLCSLGVRDDNPYNAPSRYAYLSWPNHTWWGETCGTPDGRPYQTTGLWLAQLAKWLTPALGYGNGVLDLRALGVICCVLVAVLLGWLAWLLPLPVVPRLLAIGLTWLVIADGGIAGYFISPYPEAAGLVGILALLIAVLAYWRTPQVGPGSLVAVTGTAMFTIAVKAQTAIFLVTVVPLLLARHSWGATLRARMRARTPEREAWPLREVPLQWVRSRVPALIASAALIAGTVGYLEAQPESYGWSGDYSLVSALTHGLRAMGSYRPGYLSSYPPSSHLPNTQECRVCAWQTVWRGTAGHWSGFVVLFTLAALVVCGRLAVTRAGRRHSSIGVLGLFVGLSMIAQFWSVTLSQGSPDIVRHLVLADFLAGLLAVLSLVAGYLLLTTHPRAPRTPA